MSHSPVTEGEFHSGNEWMLWRPGLNQCWLRWRAARRSTVRTMIAATLAGIGLATLAARDDPSRLDWVMITSVVVIAMVSIVGAAVDYHCAEFDHRHRSGKPCFLEVVPGKYFYRASDFHDCSPSIMESVCRVITVVRAVHTSPAAGWLTSEHLREVHQVAWETLLVLDASRPLRDALGAFEDACGNPLVGPRSAEASGLTNCFAEDLETARLRVAAIDDAVAQVVTCMLQTELLVSSWERCLADIETRTQLRAALDWTPQDVGAITARRAETVTESIFACVTAARDLTDAGRFAWERPCPGDADEATTTDGGHLPDGGAW